MPGPTSANPIILEKLVAEAKASGGSERGNYQKFIDRLCEGLGLPQPDMSKEDRALNDYVYERRVTFNHADGTSTSGFIDCYKRNSFILEAKQSPRRIRHGKAPDAHQPSLPMDLKAAPGKAPSKGWDQLMLAARKQAEDYARALPVDHGYPPFLLIADIGHVIEVYADFSGQGKNYAHFPNRQSYRLSMDDLLKTDVQQRLTAIWTDPHSLDPARESARVTKDVAERLAKIATFLEGRSHDPKDVAEFLMRCLFTMFAEDVGLIPNKGFENLLNQIKDTPQNFVPAMESLWSVMNAGGYAPHINTTLKKFNGGLFANSRALPLERDQINELYIAARREWKDVEPAIFGTLLERALNPRERSKLGAHYTPRAYVERLVIPTIIEPLREDWQNIINTAFDQQSSGDLAGALKTVKDFHHTLCTARVLDPACGTGNFLYVALELMKRLEGEVLEAIDMLGENQSRLLLEGETVSPKQFYGLELNPRAVPIAELVLWIGYLKWQLATSGLPSITEPILHAYGTIRQQDAILAYDKQELLTDAQGRPLSRWDGVTRKLHPITGEEIPDPDAQVPLWKYVNPKPAKWPEVEFIVGNPPFIGAKYMRQELGDGYAEACWKVRKDIPGGADFVMHFWNQAAEILLRKGDRTKPNPLRRFGFITTNSITQTFSRRVIENRMKGSDVLSLVFAVPDHPWLKASDKAAVRIAMTVAVKGEHKGVLAEAMKEDALDTDTPVVDLLTSTGKISSDFTIGADLGSAQALLSNSELSSRGVALHGAGFIVTPQQAASLGLGKIRGLEKHLLHYRNGRDVAQRSRDVMVIDLDPLSIEEVSRLFPAVYQHVLENVKPERDENRESSRKEFWWWFGRRHSDLRDFLSGLPRYITTVQTAKHRFFQFLESNIRPDDMLVNIGSQSAFVIGVLSSRLHVLWMLIAGGTLEDRPRYIKTKCFDTFPFPLVKPASALGERLRDLGERLDAFRKERIAAHEHLTMTGLYNALERYREVSNACAVPPLSEAEKDTHQAGLISVLAQIHDDIDRAVLSAYGWEDLIPRLVGKVGATLPSEHKSEDQQAAEEELLKRLVELNLARAADEKKGIIHWLRPDYQIPKLGKKAPSRSDEEAQELDLDIADEGKREKFPASDFDQLLAVRKIVSSAPSPVSPQALATAFDGRNTPARRQRIAKVLDVLIATGSLRREGDGEAARYFAPK